MNRQTSRTTLIIALILVLACIGVIFYARSGSTPVQNPVPSRGGQGVEWPSTVVRDAVVREDGKYYTINATYPVTQDDVINGYFKTFVTDSIAQFKEDTSWAKDNSDSAEAASLSLEISYTHQRSARADNVVFSTGTYTGGAHGLQTTKTFVFSPTGQQITLSGLFSNGINGLKTVAPYVRQQLMKMENVNADFVAEGTEPTEANFERFVVTDAGITFIFDPYQVAAYSEGTQTVDVPFSMFRSVASKDVFDR